LNHRPANENDLDLLAIWNKQLIEDEDHDNSMTVARLRERLSDWLKGDYQVFVFSKTSTPSAYAVFQDRDDHIYLRQFFVDRAQRRCGIGKEALAILKNCILPGTKSVMVEVMAWNQRGRAFWEASGFSPRYIGLELKR
jgi:GNAT superfamily N-acetyltransferase